MQQECRSDMKLSFEENDRETGSIGLLAKGLRWLINELSAVLVPASPWKNLGFIPLHFKKGNREMLFCLFGLFLYFDFMFCESGNSNCIFYNPFHRELQYFSIPFCVSFL